MRLHGLFYCEAGWGGGGPPCRLSSGEAPALLKCTVPPAPTAPCTCPCVLSYITAHVWLHSRRSQLSNRLPCSPTPRQSRHVRRQSSAHQCCRFMPAPCRLAHLGRRRRPLGRQKGWSSPRSSNRSRRQRCRKGKQQAGWKSLRQRAASPMHCGCKAAPSRHRWADILASSCCDGKGSAGRFAGDGGVASCRIKRPLCPLTQARQLPHPLVAVQAPAVSCAVPEHEDLTAEAHPSPASARPAPAASPSEPASRGPSQTAMAEARRSPGMEREERETCAVTARRNRCMVGTPEILQSQQAQHWQSQFAHCSRRYCRT